MHIVLLSKLDLRSGTAHDLFVLRTLTKINNEAMPRPQLIDAHHALIKFEIHDEIDD